MEFQNPQAGNRLCFRPALVFGCAERAFPSMRGKRIGREVRPSSDPEALALSSASKGRNGKGSLVFLRFLPGEVRLRSGRRIGGTRARLGSGTRLPVLLDGAERWVHAEFTSGRTP